MVYWDNLGFETAYTVDPEPEYPGDGDWRTPIVALFDQASGPIALISPVTAESWLLSVSFADNGAIYGTPDPNRICVLDRYGYAISIDVRSPDDRVQMDNHPVRVGASVKHRLLLIAGWADLAAFGPDGSLVWRSEQLVPDDLKLRRTNGDVIVCRGADSSGTPGAVEVTVDTLTGRVIHSGPHRDMQLG
ncbi:MAG TPA: hypothetical protein VGM94_11365 [Galbitalea sp.]|jgi:hypothetical protein